MSYIYSKLLHKTALKFITDRKYKLYAVKLTSKPRFVLAVLQSLHETAMLFSTDLNLRNSVDKAVPQKHA